MDRPDFQEWCPDPVVVLHVVQTPQENILLFLIAWECRFTTLQNWIPAWPLDTPSVSFILKSIGITINVCSAETLYSTVSMLPTKQHLIRSILAVIYQWTRATYKLCRLQLRVYVRDEDIWWLKVPVLRTNRYWIENSDYIYNCTVQYVNPHLSEKFFTAIAS